MPPSFKPTKALDGIERPDLFIELSVVFACCTNMPLENGVSPH